MRRSEVYEAMSRERIILFPTLILKLNRLPESDLIARWRGTVDLTMDYCPENRPGWMSKVFWTPTALEVGRGIIAKERAHRERVRLRLQKLARLNNLKLRKWASWQRCADKRKLIETHLATQGHDPFYCRCIQTQFLNSGVDLETLPAAYVTLWLWEALPPPEQSLPLPRQRAAAMPEAV